MQQLESITRVRVTNYTTALFIAVSSSVFFLVVPFIPASPVLPILVGLGLGALSFRNSGLSLASLYILVYFSILWQLIGFGFFQLLRSGVGIALMMALAAPLFIFANRRVQLTAFPLAILAAALVLTPYYYVSIPLIAAAATVSGFASLEALAITFVLFLSPFLLLENALYFTTVSNATAPIVFGQASLLSESLRPPLPGLNVFLTGLPQDFISPHASAVSAFLSQNSAFVLVPMLLMAVVLAIASSAGGVFRSFIERFARMHEKEGTARLVAPVGVSIVVAGVFVGLIAALSQPGSGGFQTSLTNDASHAQIALLLASSVLLGSAFVGREELIRRMERVEFGRAKLDGLVRECQRRIKEVGSEVEEILGDVPSANLAAEQQELSENASYLNDVQRQLPGANAQALDQWNAHLEGTVLPHLVGSPERLKKGVMNELLNVSLVTASVNDHLAEAGVAMGYPALRPFSFDDPLESAVASYKSSMAGVRDMTTRLADLYSSNLDAISLLMGQTNVSVPVSPDALLDSHEYVTAMRLVSEEYWLGFHLRWAEELDAKKRELVEALGMLEPYLAEEQLSTLRSISSGISKAVPADSAGLLERVGELRSFLGAVASSLEEGAELVRKTVGSFDASVRRALPFQTVNRLDEMRAMSKELGSVGPTLSAMTKFLAGAIPVIAGQSAAWKNDQENLVMVAQYPLARSVIRGMMGNGDRLLARDLPFERRTTTIYLRIYVSEDSSVTYDEEKEALLKNA